MITTERKKAWKEILVPNAIAAPAGRIHLDLQGDE